MNKKYYLSENGSKVEDVSFDKPYIFVACGSQINFNPKKVKEILKNQVSFAIDLNESSVSEFHYNHTFFSLENNTFQKNTVSDLSIEEFLGLISQVD